MPRPTKAKIINIPSVLSVLLYEACLIIDSLKIGMGGQNSGAPYFGGFW